MPRLKDDPERRRTKDAAMQAAAERLAARNGLILAARDGGEDQESVAARFGLSPGAVGKIVAELRAGRDPGVPNPGALRSAGSTSARRASGLPPRPHPTTGHPDYSDEEFEFLRACESHRQASGRPFLLACDYLHVLRSLGYAKA